MPISPFDRADNSVGKGESGGYHSFFQCLLLKGR